jgi:hypothetical protein
LIDRPYYQALLFLILVAIAFYRRKKRKVSLIAINTDSLCLAKFLIGELIIYADQIEEVSIFLNNKTTIKTAKTSFSVIEIDDVYELIIFCYRNKVLTYIEDFNGNRETMDFKKRID